MTLSETVDKDLSLNQSKYKIRVRKENFLLKTIHIPKEDTFTYSFIGGMWYSKTDFSLNFDTISLPYPFTTYYTLKIKDKIIFGRKCRSAIYVKMPILVLQTPKKCYLVEFDPVITINGQDVFPFIDLKETEKSYDLSFYLARSYEIKQKESAWLGRGKKSTFEIEIKKDDSFDFNTSIHEYKNWEEAVGSTLKKSFEKNKVKNIDINPEKVFINAKNALWRSYDHKRGTFLQLPWRNTPGFTFADSSYSLLSYEAVRLDYFSKWYTQTKDVDFLTWMEQLHDLFLREDLHTMPKTFGKGIIWYNMTTLTKKGLVGYFYMDTGYSGYPGGQASIDYHLLNYVQIYPDKKLEHLIEQSLEYIMSTQRADGSWPMAIKHEGVIKFRKEKLDQFTTSGGTAESVRALLLGSQFFNNDNMKKAALKGLSHLMDDQPICYNGLRDIGVMEPEAFSSVTIINAFLDVYDLTKENKYLKYAKTYAAYTFPWIYQWSTKQLSFSSNFHPISYSITPRLSPYETTWIISTYDRLKQYTKERYLENLNISLFNHVTSWISETGGLSEGIFPDGLSGFKRLPMEQTFATVELMKSAETLQKKALGKPRKAKKTKGLDNRFQLKKDENKLLLFCNDSLLFSFDASTAKIDQINDNPLNELGITFSFYGAYSSRSSKRFIKNQLRGNKGKYLLGAKDASYALSGVKGPISSEKINIDPLKNHLISYEITVKNTNTASIKLNTLIHHIILELNFSNDNDQISIDMNILVEVNAHDLPTKQCILLPLFGAKPESVSDKQIDFSSFCIQGDCTHVVKTDSFIGLNQTLATNWTHAGIFKKDYTFKFSLK